MSEQNTSKYNLQDGDAALLHSQSEALQVSERRLRTLVDHFPNGAVVLYDHDLRFSVAGGQGLAEAGLPPDFFEGKTVWEAFSPEVAAINGPLMRAALAGRASTQEVAYGDRIYELTVLPVRDENGNVTAGMTLTQDITRRKDIETQQRFLAGATRLLTSSLDYQTTLQSVAQLVVPQLADLCVVHLLDADGELEMVTAAHVDPVKVEAARELARRYPPRINEVGGVVGVVRAGKSHWLENITGEMMRVIAQDEAHYEMLAASGMRSYLCVPLTARGKTLGAITFIGAESGHRYTQDSLPLAEELARYAAIAVDNARLFAQAQQEIAGREQAQNALEASEKQLRLVMDAAPVLISYIDTQQRYRFNNRAYADWLKQSPEQINGKHVSEVIGNVAYEAIKEQIGEALGGREIVYEREMRYQGVDPRFVHSTFVPDRDEQGEVKGFVAVVRDMTENKRQQDALAESERRYRFMAESIPQIVWTALPDGSVDYYNQRWMEYTGLSMEQTTEWNWRGCQHPDDLQPTLDAWMRVLQSGADYKIEHRIRGKDGAYRWFLTRGAAMRDAEGSVLKWFGTITDIDDQKRAQERERLLGELGERMRAAHDPNEVLRVAVSMVGEYLQTSRCYYADLVPDDSTVVIHDDYCRDVASWAGTYNRSDFGGQVITELSRGGTVSVADTLTDPRTSAHYEAMYLPKNIRAYLAVPLMQNGRQAASLVVSQADKPRVWTLEEIALLQTVAARTQMAVENARLWQAERERTQQLTLAIAEVHHRVKNSLQGVSALLEMQLPFDSDVIPVSTVREGLNQIKTIALVHDLLARDRPIGNVDAAQVLTKLVDLLGASMRTVAHPDPIHVTAEQAWIPTKAATSLALAVNELVSNAAKHNPQTNQKSGQQSGQQSDQENAARLRPIEVSLVRRESSIHVTVQDSGRGFPADFDPRRDANIGLELVLTLVRHDLHGDVTFSNIFSNITSNTDSAAADNADSGAQNLRRNDTPNEKARIQGGRVEIIFPEDVVSE